MNLQEIRESQVTALHELYKRVGKIAGSMDGTAMEGAVLRRRTVDVAEPRDESVPALFVEMPNSFQVEFAPPDVLRPGALFVKARRLHHGEPKNEWIVNFMQGNWMYSQKLVSDDEIRKCLMPDGPRAAAY